MASLRVRTFSFHSSAECITQLLPNGTPKSAATVCQPHPGRDWKEVHVSWEMLRHAEAGQCNNVSTCPSAVDVSLFLTVR